MTNHLKIVEMYDYGAGDGPISMGIGRTVEEALLHFGLECTKYAQELYGDTEDNRRDGCFDPEQVELMMVLINNATEHLTKFPNGDFRDDDTEFQVSISELRYPAWLYELTGEQGPTHPSGAGTPTPA